MAGKLIWLSVVIVVAGAISLALNSATTTLRMQSTNYVNIAD